MKTRSLNRIGLFLVSMLALGMTVTGCAAYTYINEEKNRQILLQQELARINGEIAEKESQIRGVKQRLAHVGKPKASTRKQQSHSPRPSTNAEIENLKRRKKSLESDVDKLKEERDRMALY